MTVDKRKGWLAGLKVGDEVAIEVPEGRDCIIAPIDQILAGGKMRIASRDFTPAGRQVSERYRISEGFEVVPVTPARRVLADRLRRENELAVLLNRAGMVRSDLSDADLDGLFEDVWKRIGHRIPEVHRSFFKGPALKYYVRFDVLTRGDQDMSALYVVPKDVFDALLPHADALARGSIPAACKEAYEAVHDAPEANLRPDQVDRIPDEQYIYIAVC